MGVLGGGSEGNGIQSQGGDDFASLVPGGPGGGSGNLLDFATSLIPDIGGGNVTDDHSFNLTVTENAKGPVMEQVDNYYLNGQRSNIGNLPK